MIANCSPAPLSRRIRQNLTSGKSRAALALIAASTLVIVALSSGPSAQAATKTFSAGTSWNVAGDWSPSGTPVAADALLFSTLVPATTNLNATFTADTLSFNTASTMAIDANASVTTARTLTLNNTTTNANGTSDIISLIGGGTINLGVTASKGTLTVALVNAANNINVADGSTLIFGANSVISGTGKALSFTGNSTGTLTMAGTNTFTGGFTLTAGTLNINNTKALGSAASTFVINGGTLDNTSGSSKTLANNQPITIGANLTAFGAGSTSTSNLNLGTGAVTNADDRTITLNGTGTTLTMGGLMTNSKGAAQTTTVNGAGNTFSLGSYALSNSATNYINVINGTGNVTITGVVSNGGTSTASGLTYNGTGTLALNGTNTFTGGLNVQSGIVQLGAAAGAGAGLVTLGVAGDATSGTLDLNGGSRTINSLATAGTAANQTIQNSAGTAATLNYTGATTSTFGGVIKDGPGASTTAVTVNNASANVTFSGANTYSGVTTVTSGTLTLSGTNSSAGNTSGSGGIIQLNNASNGGLASGTLTLSNGTLLALTSAAGTLSNPVTLATGSGGYTIGGSQNITLNGDVTFTGQTTKGFVNSMTGGATLTLNGSFLNLSAPTTNTYNSSGSGSTVINSVIRTLGGGGPGSLSNSGGTLTLTNANTYEGTTSVSGGTLVITGTNTSAGATTLTGGTLQLANTTANNGGLASGPLSLSGGTLQATSAAALSLANTVSLTASSTISGAQDLTLSNTLSQTGSSTLTSSITGGKTLTLSGTNLNLDAVTGTALTLTLAGTGNTTINSVIQDWSGGVGTAGGKLTITNTGTTILTAANTYTGLTTMNAAAGTLVLSGTNNSAGATTLTTGTLQLNNASNGGLASGLLTLTAGTLQSLQANQSLSNAITLTAVTVSGTNNINFNGKLTGLTGASRALTSSITGNTLTLSDVDINTETANARTLTLAGSGNTTVTGVIANGNGTTANLFTITNTGTTTLSGSASNTYTGATSITGGGTLLLAKTGSANAIAGSLTVGGANNTAATVQYTGASSNMMGTGTVTINGRGVLDFNGATDTIGNVAIVSTGATTTNPTPIINTAGGGTLTIGTLGITPVAGFTSVINAGTGTLTLGGDVTFTAATTGQAQITGTNLTWGAARTFTVNLGTGANQDLLIDAAISDGGFGLIKAGTGRLALTGANGSSYTGTTAINAGTLSFTNHALGDGSGAITFGGGTLQYASHTQDVSARIASSTSAIKIDANNNALVFATALGSSNTGGLTLTSTTAGGSLILTGNNLYTGVTTVTSGTLKLAASSSLASGNALTTVAGGTFDINDNAQTLGTVTTAGVITNSGAGTPTLTIGNGSTGAGTFTGPMNLVWNNGATAGSITGSTLGMTGNLTLNANGAGTIAFGQVRNAGTVTNSGTGTGTTTLTSIGTDITAIIQNSTTSALTINGGLTVNSGGTTVTNTAGGAALTYAGSSSGTGNLILQNNSSLAAGLNFTGGTINHTGTITNSGTGTGSTTIGSTISTNVLGIVQDSATSTLNLGGTNTFTTGILIKKGTVQLTNAAGGGTGAITLGDSAGGANAASLLTNASVATPNPIVLASNTTGVLSVGVNSGAVTVPFTGGITGSNNLALANGGTGVLSFTTNPINNAGTITNASSGTGGVTISGGVGSNVTSINQNSTTSALTISTTPLNVNSGGTTLTNTAGTAKLTVSGGVTGTGDLILNNNSATAAGITLSTGVVSNIGTITNSGTGNGTTTISAVIGSAGITNVTQNSASSMLILSGTNTFVGSLNIVQGMVQLGSAGGLGNSLVTIGSTGNSTTLDLNGQTATITGLATAGTAANQTIGNSSTAANAVLSYTGATPSTFGGVIKDAVSGGTKTTGLTVNYAGANLILTGANIYTGATTVTAGMLTIGSGGSLAAGSAVTITGGVIGGTGTINGSVLDGGTGTINLVDGTIGNLTLGSTLVINGAAGANNLNFDLASGGGGTDKLIVASTTSVTNTGAAVINLNQLGGATNPITAGTYTLIQGGSTMAAASKFALATSKAFGETFTLGVSGNNLQVTTAPGTAGPAAVWWKGGATPWSTATNWNTDATSNVAAGAAPGYQTNVNFYTTTPAVANLTTGTVDVDFDINSLNFASTTTSNVTIGGTKMLTIEAGTANGNAAGNGITVNTPISGTPTNTISANIGLASNQTWTVNSGAALTVSGAISDFGAGYALTKAGAGTLTLSGATSNTYTGVTTVSGGELDLNKSAGDAIGAGGLVINNGTVKLLASNQILGSATVEINAGGTFNLNGVSDAVAGVTLAGASGSPATVNLSNGTLKLLVSPTLTFGANTVLTGPGTVTSATATDPMTFNFNGGQLSGAISTGSVSTTLTSTTVNVTAGMGGGSITAGGSQNSAGTSLAVNLNQTGSIDLGATLLAYSNGSGGTPTLLNVNIANTATGMSGGIISAALATNAANPTASLSADLYNNVANTLTFASGGSGFTLSGGVIDVRSNSTTVGYGAITTNGNPLTISGGTLLGNRFLSTTGAITLSSGNLGLRNTGAGNFTVSTTDGTDGRTIKMLSGDTGTLTLAGGSTSRIIIGSLSDGGTWDRGTINAGSSYTINADSSANSPFGSSFSSYTIASNSGLNGVVMGSNALPSLLTLGTNASFFAASSTAPARTYNVGVTGGSNDIVVPASGNIRFGINNTDSAQAQIINLNRDKGNDTVTLVSNGASTSSGVNIATDQTGSGNLYVLTKQLTIASGATFGGTGAISNDLVPGNGTNEFPLDTFAGPTAGAGAAVGIVFTINGTINGTNTINLNRDNTSGSSFVIGSTGAVGGTQTWTNVSSGGGTFSTTNFSNQMTTPSNWTNGSVSFTTRGAQGTFEASTSTVSPSASSSYKFNSLAITPGSGSTTGGYELVNSYQNDGGSAKEAFYAGTLSISGGISDSSNGHYLFNLNGQDLYVDSFSGITGLQNKGLSFQNDALDTVSEVRALSTTGATLVGGSFQVLNGATLQFNGGNVNNLIFARNTGGSSGTLLVADTAAAPNNGVSGGSDVKKTLFHNNTTADIGTFTSFLGSGTDKGTNAATNLTGTNGTLRVIGGSYSTSGYILNPVGTIGLIDTTDGVTDTAFNDVLIRSNIASDSGGAGNATDFAALIVAGTTTINGNLIIGNATGAAVQATLRVGGDSAVGYSTSTGPSAHSGTGMLIVNGDLTTQSAVNVSIQSNGNVKAGGNVSIAGVGTSVSFATNPITGMDGVGINAASNFTLNGNKGVGTPQTVNIVPTVGNFHVGDGSGGTLTGTAAQAQLTVNLTSASGVDINGSSSRLNLGGFTLTANGSGLAVGGVLAGNGIVAGATAILSGGAIHASDTVGLLTFNDAVTLQSGSAVNIAINGSAARGADYSGVNFNGGLTVLGGTLTFSISTPIDGGAMLNIFDAATISPTFTSVGATGSYNGTFTLNNDSTAYIGVFGSQTLTFDLASGDLFFTSAIPEPASWSALLGAAGLAFAACRRRSRKA